MNHKHHAFRVGGISTPPTPAHFKTLPEGRKIKLQPGTKHPVSAQFCCLFPSCKIHSGRCETPNQRSGRRNSAVREGMVSSDRQQGHCGASNAVKSCVEGTCSSPHDAQGQQRDAPDQRNYSNCLPEKRAGKGTCLPQHSLGRETGPHPKAENGPSAADNELIYADT